MVSPLGMIATGLITSNRLNDVPNAEPFKTNLLISGLMCANPAAQLVFNIRNTDQIADVLNENDRLKKQMAGEKLAVVKFPTITGKPAKEEVLTATRAEFRGASAPPTLQWVFNGSPNPKEKGVTYKVQAADAGASITVREIVSSSEGSLVVESAAIDVPKLDTR